MSLKNHFREPTKDQGSSFYLLLYTKYGEKQRCFLKNHCIGLNLEAAMSLYATVIPAKDELSLSFYSRMSQANGFNETDSFLTQFIFERKYSLFGAYNSQYSGSNTGLNMPVFNLLKHLRSENPVQDPENFLKEHTLYPVYSFLKTKKQQQEFIEHYCHGKGNGSEFLKGINRPVYFCLDCMREDYEKNGFVFAHRSHQVLGVYVCPVHGTHLYYSDTQKNSEMFENMFKKETTGFPDPSLALQYARMCKDLLDSPISAEAITLEKTVTNTVKHISYTACDNKYLNLAAVDSGFVESKTYDPFSFEKNVSADKPFIEADTAINVNKSLVKLFLLYRDADMLRKAINCHGNLQPSDQAHVEMNLLTDDYEIISSSEAPKTVELSLRHKKCGIVFQTTIRKFGNGNRCLCEHEPGSISEFVHSRTGMHVVEVEKKSHGLFSFDCTDTPMTKKQVIQEICRPYLSPVFGFTRENKFRKEQINRAIEIYESKHIQEKYFSFSSTHLSRGEEVSRKKIADFFQALPELQAEPSEIVDMVIDQFAKASLYQYVKLVNIGNVGKAG